MNANFADKSITVELKAPIHGNQERPDFVRFTDKGEPFLHFDSTNDKVTALQP